MTAIIDFIPYVVPHAAGCSDIVARRAIIQAVDRFCRDTWYYRERSTAQLILDTDTIVGDFNDDFPNPITVNGLERYPIAKTRNHEFVITAPATMRPHAVADIQVGGKFMLQPITDPVAANTAAYWDQDGFPAYFTQTPTSVAEIFPSEDSAPDVVISVVFVPTATAASVPDMLFIEFREVIADAAIADLLSQPDQPYSNVTGSQQHEAKYRKGMGLARMRLHTANTNASLTVTPVRWA